jgi:hypothetical protein
MGDIICLRAQYNTNLGEEEKLRDQKDSGSTMRLGTDSSGRNFDITDATHNKKQMMMMMMIISSGSGSSSSSW